MLPSESKHGQPPLLSSITIPDLTDRIIRSENPYCDAGGSFGDVFRCRYASDDGVKEVAVKAFRFNFTVDECNHGQKKVARMIRRELGIWSRLNHRNIVPFLGIIHGFGRQGNASLVSLWMPHGTLHTFLEAHGNQLVVAHRLKLLLDIASGLQYLHLFSIVHGDLTSNNVLLDHNYNACLTDFGCASLVGKFPEGFTYLQASTRRPGTLRWAAPEHFSTDETGTEHTIKSDIYSFGNMALLVLSGKYPWSEIRGEAAVVLQLSLGRKPARPLVPPIDDQHWAFIQWCWSAIPERPLAEDVVSSLHQLLDPFPPPATLRDLLDAPLPSSSIQTYPRNEAKHEAMETENTNLRDLLSRLQQENLALKQAQFTFSPPIPAPTPNSILQPPLFSFFDTPSLLPPPSAPALTQSKPSTFGTDIDWSSLTTFDPSVLSVLDEPQYALPQSYKTIVNNPLLMSFVDKSPSIPSNTTPSANSLDHYTFNFSPPPNSWTLATQSSPLPQNNAHTGFLHPNHRLDELFGGDFTGNQDPLDFNALMDNASISPIQPGENPSVSEFLSGANAPAFPPMTTGRSGMARHIEIEGLSPFIGLPNPSHYKTSASEAIVCQGSTFPQTKESPDNIEVLKAWRCITQDPHFKDVDINELCNEFAKQARCDGTKVVLEPEGVHQLFEKFRTLQRVSTQQ